MPSERLSGSTPSPETATTSRVQALSEADNHRALRFARHALGFTREGGLRNFERDAQGRLRNQVMFAAYNSVSA